MTIEEILAGESRNIEFKESLPEKSIHYMKSVVAGTTRPADESMIKELAFEGSNRHFDQTLCPEFSITDTEINALCRALKEQAVKNAHTEEQKAAIKEVSKSQLRSWGVLVERNGKDYPSNAYAILTGTDPLHFAIQCGVFKGTTKEIFVDRREYTGPIWEQIDEAFQFVLRNIHLGASIVGIYRQDIYEIPPGAIRELIINAAVHRSYLDHGNIYVAIYDNRLEITSPGKLPMGQTLERMKEGYSRIRNEALAHAFSYMNLIEHWGSGIPKIISKVKAAGLAEPEFIGGDVDLRINIYRKSGLELQPYGIGTAESASEPYQITAASMLKNASILPESAAFRHVMPENAGKCQKTAKKFPKDRQERLLYEYVLTNQSISSAEAATLLDVKPRRAREILHKLLESHWLQKEGASRSTVYTLAT